jgi:hypothetical protein
MQIKITLSLVVLFSIIFFVPSDAFGAWYDTELESLIGIPHESVPKWVVNFATWVSEDKITPGDMIIAIEHIINN